MSIKFASRKKFILMLLVTALFVTGCGANIFIERYVPNDADEFVRGYIDKLRGADIEAALAGLAPEMATEAAPEALKKMGAVLNQGELLSVKLVKFRNIPSYFTGNRRSTLTYHIELPDVWLYLTTVVDRTKDGVLSVYGLYVKPMAGNPAEINTFSFAGKGLKHYFVLLMALVVYVFIIYTAVLCLRTPMHKKWRWFILVLLGFGNFMFDWTTGLWGFRLVSGWFLGGLILRDGLDGPWMVYIAVPVGAFLFYVRRRSMIKHYEHIERYRAGLGEEDE